MQTLVTRTGEVREHQKAGLWTSLPSQGGTRLSWENLNAFSCKDPKQAGLDSSLADGGRGARWGSWWVQEPGDAAL